MVWCGGGAALAIAGLASSETMEMAMAMLRSGGGGGSLEGKISIAWFVRPSGRSIRS